MKLLKNSQFSWLVSLILLLVSVINFFLINQKLPDDSHRHGNKVIAVIDGDSIVVNSGVLIRLHGLDAPDLKHCYGHKAKKYLEQLVLGKNVSLEELAKGEHDRILALVYLNNTLINKLILENGYAELFGAQTSQKGKLKQANRQARDARRGIYGECILTEPINPRCSIKGNIHARNKTKYYHLPNCPSYKQTKVETFRGEQWFCNESEAKEKGFIKSPNCP